MGSPDWLVKAPGIRLHHVPLESDSSKSGDPALIRIVWEPKMTSDCGMQQVK